jgi:hypothetical protein
MRDKSFLCAVKKKTQCHRDVVQRVCKDIRRVKVLRDLGFRNGVYVERSRRGYYSLSTGKIITDVSEGHSISIFRA